VYRLLLGWLLMLTVPGCAGFRGGWDSAAYIGNIPAVPSSAAGRAPASADGGPLTLPGLKLAVSLDNRLRTYDVQVYLYVLPLWIDPRTVYANNIAPGTTRVYVTVTPSAPDFVFRPTLGSLIVADQRFAGSAGFEFGMWDRDGTRVGEGGTWDHRPVGAEFVLSEAGRTYHLSIDFATPAPSPESADIAIDLSHALTSPHYPAVPLIRFTPVRWKEGYS
jgi:hypothetical protein